MQLTAGYLHGFDKFMNLVLMNVDETYTVMVRVPHPYTVTTHEPAQPHHAINLGTGKPTVVTAAPINKEIDTLQLMMSHPDCPYALLRCAVVWCGVLCCAVLCSGDSLHIVIQLLS